MLLLQHNLAYSYSQRCNHFVLQLKQTSPVSKTKQTSWIVGNKSLNPAIYEAPQGCFRVVQQTLNMSWQEKVFCMADYCKVQVALRSPLFGVRDPLFPIFCTLLVPSLFEKVKAHRPPFWFLSTALTVWHLSGGLPQWIMSVRSSNYSVRFFSPFSDKRFPLNYPLCDNVFIYQQFQRYRKPYSTIVNRTPRRPA